MQKVRKREGRKIAEGLDKDLEASLQEKPTKRTVKQLMRSYSRFWEKLPDFGIKGC